MEARRLYHTTLLVSALCVAIVLLVQSGSMPWARFSLSSHARHYVASVMSVSAGVEATDLSLLTAELTKKNTELAQREAAVKAREIQAQARDQNPSSAPDYLLSSLLFLLLVLIVTNYIFDFIRARKTQTYAAVS